MNKEEEKTLVTALKVLAVAMGLFFATMLFDGCGGYQRALVPLNPAPAVSHEIETISSGEPENRSAWPLWKKVVFFGTVGH